MNFNDVSCYSGGTLRNQIPVLSGIGTTETVVSTTTDTGTAPAILAIPSQTAITGAGNGLGVNRNAAVLVHPHGLWGQQNGQQAPFFNSASFDGRGFKIRAMGTFTSGVASNDLQIGLYLGTSATVGSNTAISTAINTGTSGAFGAVSGHFIVEAKLLWDSTSGKVDGTIWGFIAPSGVARLPVGGNAPAYLTQFAAAAAPNLNFVLTAKWNASNAGNVLQVTDYALEAI